MKKAVMKNSRMKTIITGIVLIGLIGGGIFAVKYLSDRNAEKDFKYVAEEFGKVILAQDADSAVMDEAIQAVGAYLDSSSDETLLEAWDILETSKETLLKRKENFVPYETDKEGMNKFKKCGISFEEFSMLDTTHVSTLSDYIFNIENLQIYIGYELTEDPMREDLKECYEFVMEYNENNKGYMGCGINYWFAGVDEQEKAYLDEYILNHIQSFKVKDIVWEDTREAVERRLTIYLDELEDLLLESAIDVGQEESELREFETEIQELQQ